MIREARREVKQELDDLFNENAKMRERCGELEESQIEVMKKEAAMSEAYAALEEQLRKVPPPRARSQQSTFISSPCLSIVMNYHHHIHLAGAVR